MVLKTGENTHASRSGVDGNQSEVGSPLPEQAKGPQVLSWSPAWGICMGPVSGGTLSVLPRAGQQGWALTGSGPETWVPFLNWQRVSLHWHIAPKSLEPDTPTSHEHCPSCNRTFYQNRTSCGWFTFCPSVGASSCPLSRAPVSRPGSRSGALSRDDGGHPAALCDPCDLRHPGAQPALHELLPGVVRWRELLVSGPGATGWLTLPTAREHRHCPRCQEDIRLVAQMSARLTLPG